MQPQTATSCPSCGTATTGAFCSHCGTAVGSRRCASCGAALASGARFCGNCGAAAATAAGAVPAGRQVMWAYLLVGVAVVSVVLALVWSNAKPALPAADSVGGDPTAIDLSTMTPRERFDRLYDRVMRAAESGDDATVTQFSPMALAAYAQLDAVDADARYHAAMIRMHTGDPAGATALADTIRAEAPDHLFSFVIHATLARQRGDQARLQAEYAGFLERYDAELAAQRLEYGQHQFILDQVRDQARAGAP